MSENLDDYRHGSRKSRRNAILKVVIVVILVWVVVVVLRAPTTEDADLSAGQSVLTLQTSLNEAGFPVARAMLAIQTCSTDSDCDEALGDFRTTLATYEPILGDAIAELGVLSATSIENPALLNLVISYRDLNSIRLEAVRLYMKAIGSPIDFDMLGAGDQKWEESVLKLSDVLDALQRYSETEK